MLVSIDEPEADELARGVVPAIWSPELASEIRTGLERVAAQGGEWRPAAEAALLQFDHDPTGAPVTLAVTQRLAWDLGDEDTPLFFCLLCLDEAVSNAPRGSKRALAVQAGVVARRDAALPRDELAFALRRGGERAAVERLGTVERRRVVRARLGRLARLGHGSVSALAAELSVIAAEPLPERAADDDVWMYLGTAIVADVRRPELN